jgi:hypothetical protein
MNIHAGLNAMGNSIWLLKISPRERILEGSLKRFPFQAIISATAQSFIDHSLAFP